MSDAQRSRCGHLRPWCHAVPGGVTVGLVSVLIGAWAVPVMAQTAPAAIKAKEGRDPAAGRVVVINGANAGSTAPDPYAPIKLRPLPQNRSKAPPTTVSRPTKATTKPATSKTTATTATKPKSKGSSAKAKTPPPVTRTAPIRKASVAKPRHRTPSASQQRPPVVAKTINRPVPRAAIPPLPVRNTFVRRNYARLPHNTQSPLTTPGSAGRYSYRPTPPGFRPNADDRPPLPEPRVARRNYDDDRIYRAGAPRGRQAYDPRFGWGERPWQRCRQLAWRCQDGFERACDRWEQLCY